MHGSIGRVGPGLAVTLVALPSVAPAQTVHYAYDAAGRLSVVADPRGDLAVYEYDAVGNLLSIVRIDVGEVGDAVVIAHVTPGVASRGAVVSIFGKGFGATPDANAVFFNDVPAAVLAASATRLTVRVPDTATTGSIHLATPLGGATSQVFHVLGALSVTPPSAVVAPRGRLGFTASGAGTPGVRWSVDRVAGGDPQRGTITPDGVYVAPQTLPPGGVRVTATSIADSAVEATAVVSMIVSRPLFIAAEPLTVAVASQPTFAVAAPLTVRVAPVILGVTPPTAARGETTRVVLTGAGFEGATRLEFWTVTGPDATLTVTDLIVSADGHEAAAGVTVSIDAAPGPRIVRLLTPSGPSGGAVPGENVFIVR